MSDRTKTLVAKVAYFTDDFEDSLEGLLRAIFQKVSKPRERVVQNDLLKSTVFGVLEENPSGPGVYVRVYEFEEGATGVINFDSTNTTASVEEFLPPEGRRFLSDEVCMLVNENRVMTCGFGNRNRSLSGSIIKLALALGLVKDVTSLSIEDLPNQVSLRELRDVGVRSINLDVTGYLESLPPSVSIKDKILRALLVQPLSDEEHRKRAATVARIGVKRGAYSKDEIHKDKWLTELGEDVLTEADAGDYTIILENGKKLTAKQLRRQKPVKVKRHANSVNYDQVKMELHQFAKEVMADEA